MTYQVVEFAAHSLTVAAQETKNIAGENVCAGESDVDIQSGKEDLVGDEDEVCDAAGSFVEGFATEWAATGNAVGGGFYSADVRVALKAARMKHVRVKTVGSATGARLNTDERGADGERIQGEKGSGKAVF
ncbi:hypothetical protein GYMLUDRAFT_242936 [Collybiopsis luxurians FD-317 M1]|uniref:Unplaced genomic scaffold GYMLUscaffold_20, whole genome shotgun sequence n=1 Tax=Collybiopsis luxurians FD-317 M1 TaxID=944289 RepID=A0A0D0C2C0_9AGAR|nr:hypothetical protein GYMLUDRAFT_242936 [Collybiopsis luxurians FD-317 M1]